MSGRVDSYNRNARTPSVGSRWVWEIDSHAARALVKVIEVKWNGEEWWVKTRTLLPNFTYPPSGNEHWNDLSRFCEATVPVGAALPGTWQRSATSTRTTSGQR